MNKFLTQIAALEWPKVFGIGAALAVAYYFLLFDPGTSIEASIKAANDRLVAAKTQLAATERAMENANRFEKEVQATSKQFEKIIEFMPSTIGAAELTAIINKQAQASGVRPRITPKGEDPPQSFYQVSKVNLELDGTFAQIVTFLSNISRVPRLLTFDKVVIKQPSGARAEMLTFSGTMMGYRYLKDAGDDSKTPKGVAPGKPVPAPGAAATKGHP